MSEHIILLPHSLSPRCHTVRNPPGMKNNHTSKPTCSKQNIYIYKYINIHIYTYTYTKAPTNPDIIWHQHNQPYNLFPVPRGNACHESTSAKSQAGKWLNFVKGSSQQKLPVVWQLQETPFNLPKKNNSIRRHWMQTLDVETTSTVGGTQLFFDNKKSTWACDMAFLLGAQSEN